MSLAQNKKETTTIFYKPKPAMAAGGTLCIMVGRQHTESGVSRVMDTYSTLVRILYSYMICHSGFQSVRSNATVLYISYVALKSYPLLQLEL